MVTKEPVDPTQIIEVRFGKFSMHRIVIALAVVAPALLGAVGLPWQEPPRISVWEGVYTSAQAARGKEAYERHCSGCHKSDLTGANGRALVGPRFWQDWGEDSLGSLSHITRTSMPRGAAASLDESVYLDIVAYILERNGYPAGADELTTERVDRVWVTRREGPGPVPNFALVRVVGCLERSADTWTLRAASEPIRTRNPDASVDAERAAIDVTPLGGSTFELMDVYSSGEARIGHRIEVKGLLIRGSPDRVNVTSVRTIAEACRN